MNKISPTSILLYPVSFAVGTGVLATFGWLGGHMLRLIVPSIVPASHAVATGLWAPATLVMLGIATLINRKGGSVNWTIAAIGGYFAAIMGARALGFTVSVAGPFLGLTSLSLPLAASVALVAPIAIALIAITNIGKTIRDFLLHAD